MARAKHTRRAAAVEMKVSGLNAVRALAERRPGDIIRVYLLEERIPDLALLLKRCAEERKAYHVVPAEELDRVAESVHHEGVCVLAKKKTPLSLDALVKEAVRSRAPMTLLLLEDVKNPHNVGAILRLAAHFGARAILLREARLSNALYRTAEGGAEAVELVEVGDVKGALGALARAGFRTVGTSSHVRESITDWRPSKRVIVALGAEDRGLSKSTMALCDELLSIPGTGAVESLNVAAAAAIVLYEAFRSRP